MKLRLPADCRYGRRVITSRPPVEPSVPDLPAHGEDERDEVNDPRIDDLQRALRARLPRTIGVDEAPHRAAVAVVVRPTPEDLELLLIKRPTSPRDPWSGHMAFPGGRREGDEDDAATAVRECREEVGIDLAAEGTPLGRLDDVHPSGGPQIAVAAFVFAVPTDTRTHPNPSEVASLFWVPVRHLADPASAAGHLHILPDGASRRFPAISYHGHVIWGLTYRMLMQFLEIVRAAGQGFRG